MLNTYSQQPKKMALFAAIASLVALIAYLVLPFISITVSATSTSSSYNGPSYTQSVQVGAGVVELFTGFICIEALLAVAVLCISGLFALREAPFGQVAMPVEVQRRRSAYTIVTLGAVAIVYQFLLVTVGTGQINAAIQNAASSSSTFSLISLLFRSTNLSVGLGYAFGSWIYLLAMLGVVACGWMIVRAEKPQTAFTPAQPSHASSTPWQQPMQPSQPQWQQSSGVYMPPSLQQGQSSPQYYPTPQSSGEQQPHPSYTPPYAQSWQQPLPPSNTGDWHSPNG